MQLNVIATDMQDTATKRGSAYYRLPRGLEIVMQRMGDQQWRLAVARRDTTPSADEITIVREAFKVPAGTEETTAKKERKHPKTNLPIHYNVVEMFWQER